MPNPDNRVGRGHGEASGASGPGRLDGILGPRTRVRWRGDGAAYTRSWWNGRNVCSRSRAATLSRWPDRTEAGVLGQAPKAAVAAVTARSTSASLLMGTWAKGSPVGGLMVSMCCRGDWSSPVGPCHPPCLHLPQQRGHQPVEEGNAAMPASLWNRPFPASDSRVGSRNACSSCAGYLPLPCQRG